MASAIEEAGARVVRARVRFLADREETPVALVKEAGEGPDRQSGTMVEHEIVLRNARPIADRLDLDRHGFVLMRHPTAVRDFYDEAEVRRLYYPEMERLIETATGAAKVVAFDHTIRVDDDAEATRLKVRMPVRGMHNDFTVRSAPQRVRDLLPADEAAARLDGRYASINVWRPIRGPVQTKPLAICEYASIDAADLVAAERHYPDGRIGGIYYLVHNPGQRWYYVPAMQRDEVILLKCFDSLTDGTARWTAHGSFDDPGSPPGAAPRESIEVRTLLFFD